MKTAFVSKSAAFLAVVGVLATTFIIAGAQTAYAASSSGYANGFSSSEGAGFWTPGTPEPNAIGAPNASCVSAGTSFGVVTADFTFPDFAIPTGDSIDGVSVVFTYNTAFDVHDIQLISSGSPTGTAKDLPQNGAAGSCGSTSTGTIGGATDLWGATLTPAEFNAGDIGVRLFLNVKMTGDATTAPLDFDAMELVVHHSSAATPPAFSVSAVPSVVELGETATVTLRVTPASPATVTGVSFTSTMPSGLTIGSASAENCGATTVFSSTSISLTGGILLAGTPCVIVANVVTTELGEKVIATSPLTSDQGGASAVSAMLTVISPPTFTKQFNPNGIDWLGSSTLTYTIENSGSPFVATDIAFVDVLPPELVALSATSNSCGGMNTASLPGNSIDYAGGTLAPGASCTIEIEVQGALPGTFVSTSGDLTSSQGNSGAASDTLTVAPVDLDNDLVEDHIDVCPATAVPELTIPTDGMLTRNRYAMVTGGEFFDRGERPGDTRYSIHDTAGCNAEQIADAMGYGSRSYERGLSNSQMKKWIRQLAAG